MLHDCKCNPNIYNHGQSGPEGGGQEGRGLIVGVQDGGGWRACVFVCVCEGGGGAWGGNFL